MKRFGRLLLGVILCLSSAQLTSAAVDERQCASLFETYGSVTLGQALFRARETRVTIEVNGALQEMLGSPDPAYVTQRSLCQDARLSALSGPEITEIIKTIQTEQQERTAQHAQTEHQSQTTTDRIVLP